MQTALLPSNEADRLLALDRYNILDTPPEKGFDRLTALAAHLFKVPIVLVSLVDREREWFKSAYGTQLRQIPREISFCAYTILDNKTMIVPDATLDPHFINNPLVTSQPFVRFYAGAPLTTADGYNLGTLCLIDHQPRNFSAEDIQTLEQLAELVMAQLEQHRNHQRLISAETTLKEQNQLLGGIFNSLSNEKVVLDRQGVIRYVSHSWERFVLENGGDLRDCGIGVNYLEVCRRAATIDPTVKETLAKIEGVLRGETSNFSIEYPLNILNDDYWFLMQVDPMPAELGGIVIAHINITERKQAEEKVKQNEQRFKALIEHSSEMITMTGRGGEVLYQSPSVTRLMGYTEAELAGRNSFELVHPDDVVGLLEQHQKLVAQPGLAHYNEFRFRHKNGNWHYMETIAHNLLHVEEIEALVINGRDVTARKNIELALRQSEEMLNFALSAAQVGIWEYEVTTGRIRWSEQVAPLLGLAPGSFEGTFEAIVNMALPEDREKLTSAVQKALVEGGEYQIEYRVMDPDGQIQWLEGKGRGYLDETGQPLRLSGIVQDITERKRAEEQLKVSLERFNKIFSVTPVSIAITRLEDGVYLDVNDVFLQLTNYTRDEIIGQKATDVMWANPEERQEFVRQLRAHGSVRSMEVSFSGKNGQPEPGLLSAEIIELGGEQCILSTFLNITERKKAEEALAKSEAQLLQSQKMEAIGQLAGGVAHDFNNLLTAITGYSDLILLSLNEYDPLYQDVTEIQQAANRAGALTRQLLAFSRKQVLQPTIVDLNEVVAEMYRMLKRLIGENVELITHQAEGLDQVKADRGQLEQVIVNLAVNARDAMPEGGKLVFKTSNIELDEEHASYYPDVKPGRYVQLSVSDTGCGMNETLRSRIFEPFFTTKERGRGTGLGLSTVYGIIKQSGGYIEVYSKEGLGSTFKIYLPAVGSLEKETDAHSSQLESAISLTSLRQEIVLLVEDEEGVRNLAARVLEQYGYKILVASNGGEALLLSEQHFAQIDLLLSDVVMPKLSGPSLAKRLMQMQPKMKVLYMSGYTDGMLTESEERLSPTELSHQLIQKPFTPQGLAKKIREVLDD